jgi:hypothetical protein
MTPTLEERVERLEEWSDVLMMYLSRLGMSVRPALTRLDDELKLYRQERDEEPGKEQDPRAATPGPASPGGSSARVPQPGMAAGMTGE